MSQHRFPARSTIAQALAGTLDPSLPGLDPNRFEPIPRADLAQAFPAVAPQFEAGFSAVAGPGSNDDCAHVSPLQAAALAGHLDLADALIARGGDLEQASPRRITPLLAACALGDPSVVGWFLERVPAEQWRTPTRSTNPYVPNIPIERLAAVNPGLARSVEAHLGRLAAPRLPMG